MATVPATVAVIALRLVLSTFRPRPASVFRATADRTALRVRFHCALSLRVPAPTRSNGAFRLPPLPPPADTRSLALPRRPSQRFARSALVGSACRRRQTSRMGTWSALTTGSASTRLARASAAPALKALRATRSPALSRQARCAPATARAIQFPSWQGWQRGAMTGPSRIRTAHPLPPQRGMRV